MLALLAAMALALTATVAAASVDDLTSDEICSLPPTDRGFSLTPDIDPARPSCQGSVGDCDAPIGRMATCVSALILLTESPAEAQSALISPGNVAWQPQSGFGEAGSVYECDPMFWCELRFQRDRFWVSVMAASDVGMGQPEAVAAQIDAALQQMITAGSGSPAPVEPPGGGEPPPPLPEPGGTAAGVFFGTDRVGALFPDIAAVLHCDPAAYAQDGLFGCAGARDAFVTLAGLDSDFATRYPSPTNRQLEGASAYSTAVLLGGIFAPDGEPLFPSVRDAMALIGLLPDPEMADQFLDLLAGNDAAQWEDRGL